ncbi:hypothetical protein GQ457_07G010400 [Hibiscus cannabinus]
MRWLCSVFVVEKQGIPSSDFDDVWGFRLGLIIQSKLKIRDDIPEWGRGGRCFESKGMGSWNVPKRSSSKSGYKNTTTTSDGSSIEFCLQDGDNTPRNILEEIIWHKDFEVSQMKDKKPLTSLKKFIENAPPSRDFVGDLKAAHSRTGLPGLIAEVKKAEL